MNIFQEIRTNWNGILSESPERIAEEVKDLHYGRGPLYENKEVRQMTRQKLECDNSMWTETWRLPNDMHPFIEGVLLLTEEERTWICDVLANKISGEQCRLKPDVALLEKLMAHPSTRKIIAKGWTLDWIREWYTPARINLLIKTFEETDLLNNIATEERYRIRRTGTWPHKLWGGLAHYQPQRAEGAMKMACRARAYEAVAFIAAYCPWTTKKLSREQKKRFPGIDRLHHYITTQTAEPAEYSQWLKWPEINPKDSGTWPFTMIGIDTTEATKQQERDEIPWVTNPEKMNVISVGNRKLIVRQWTISLTDGTVLAVKLNKNHCLVTPNQQYQKETNRINLQLQSSNMGSHMLLTLNNDKTNARWSDRLETDAELRESLWLWQINQLSINSQETTGILEALEPEQITPKAKKHLLAAIKNKEEEELVNTKLFPGHNNKFIQTWKRTLHHLNDKFNLGYKLEPETMAAML